MLRDILNEDEVYTVAVSGLRLRGIQSTVLYRSSSSSSSEIFPVSSSAFDFNFPTQK